MTSAKCHALEIGTLRANASLPPLFVLWCGALGKANVRGKSLRWLDSYNDSDCAQEATAWAT
eukprot:4848804-Alexandrium_andersonii.AAC.1